MRVKWVFRFGRVGVDNSVSFFFEPFFFFLDFGLAMSSALSSLPPPLKHLNSKGSLELYFLWGRAREVGGERGLLCNVEEVCSVDEECSRGREDVVEEREERKQQTDRTKNEGLITLVKVRGEVGDEGLARDRQGWK